MTSEVLILNKRAVVVAADSAVTTSAGDHPRYSKSAMKIFDLSSRGRVAAAIFGSAHLDLVPWELAIKMFRDELGTTTFGTVSEYLDAFIAYLSGNDTLFPPLLRDAWIVGQFDQAVLKVAKEAARRDPQVEDAAHPLADRIARWTAIAPEIRTMLEDIGIAAPLSLQARDADLANLQPWIERVQGQLTNSPKLAAFDAPTLADLAHRVRYSRPDLLLSSTGLVFAGYGEQEIFPAFRQIDVHGHIGSTLYFKDVRRYEVTHTGIPMIQPLAQASMIEVFTDGFGPSLRGIIDKASENALNKVLTDLAANGVQVPAEVAAAIKADVQKSFTEEWTRENWKQNFNPLIEVIATLDVEEMAHLAETLLVLESLKERVTSASESVGGPIDVVAITKSEGLVWIKRKHYFDPTLNMRYAARVSHSLAA